MTPETKWLFKHRKVRRGITEYRYERGASTLTLLLETMTIILVNPLEHIAESNDLGPTAFKKLKEELGIDE